MQKSEGGGHRGCPAQQQPGNHHDRQGYCGPCLHRTADDGGGGGDYPEGEAGQHSADARGTGRAEPGDGAGGEGNPEEPGCPSDRNNFPDNQESRGPSRIQGGHGEDRGARGAFAGRPQYRGRREVCAPDRISGCAAAGLHPRRFRRRHREQPGRA